MEHIIPPQRKRVKQPQASKIAEDANQTKKKNVVRTPVLLVGSSTSKNLSSDEKNEDNTPPPHCSIVAQNPEPVKCVAIFSFYPAQETRAG